MLRHFALLPRLLAPPRHRHIQSIHDTPAHAARGAMIGTARDTLITAKAQPAISPSHLAWATAWHWPWRAPALRYDEHRLLGYEFENTRFWRAASLHTYSHPRTIILRTDYDAPGSIYHCITGVIDYTLTHGHRQTRCAAPKLYRGRKILRHGAAGSPEITHYLKLANTAYRGACANGAKAAPVIAR